MWWSSWVSLLVILLIGKVTAANPQPVGFEVGQSFPNWVLPSLEDGRPLSLAQFRGQKLLLHIFASW
jgi:hypothetical protein